MKLSKCRYDPFLHTSEYFYEIHECQVMLILASLWKFMLVRWSDIVSVWCFWHTCIQAAVLLLFNSADKLSYNDIKGQLNLTDEDIVRLLHSLTCAKYKILNKDPSTRIIGQNDMFEFNTKFVDKMRRIKVDIYCQHLILFWSHVRGDAFEHVCEINCFVATYGHT